MPIATFDTLKFANTLKAAGVPDKQAEAEAAAFADVIQVNFRELVSRDDFDRGMRAAKSDLDAAVKASKADLDAAVKSLKADIDAVARTAKADLDAAVKELKHDMKELELRLNARIDTLAAQIRGEMNLLKWMLGLVTTGILWMVIRPMVTHGP